MSEFTRLKVDGFRRLCNVDLELRPLSVIIGANGSGKTSILDVFSLLSASAQSRLNDKISELGGFSAISTSGGRNADMVFGLATSLEPQRLDYELEISPVGTGYSISSERLVENGRATPHIQRSGSETSYFDSHSRSTVMTAPLNETALAHAVQTMPTAAKFREHLASSTHYHALDVRPRSPVRLPQPVKPAGLPGKDGEDLVSCLYYMRETDPDRYETILDTLKAGFASFERLDFPPVAAGTLSMVWRDRNFNSGFYPHQLSEGSLRFLWLASLLQSPAIPSITLIDEPEVSLHPELLSLLADLLREASQRSQIVVTTHSDRLVRFLRPEEVVVVDLDEGGLAQVRRADKLDLGRWLDDYALDELWRMGELGARS